ncbi:MAG: MFS transporter [Staphylococcus rostri]|uniref:MFS transporter n=1 Tax=Staphylococcus rostri TaxID=522262 RepID=UPI0026DFD549|nr:MFS transporter [Staphylococcus rostri]MDO5376417.1 MFS transporter [Staphylococcus rostri]
MKKKHLFDTKFSILYSSSIINALGNQLSIIAFPLIAIEYFNADSSLTSLVTLFIFLPNLLFSSHAGVFVDKHRKKYILIYSNIVCFLIAISMYVFIDNINIIAFFSLIFVISSVMIFSGIAFFSYVPIIVEKDNIKSANYQLEISNSIIQSIGPAIGGQIAALFKTSILVLIDGISFLISGLLHFLIPSNKEVLDYKENESYFKSISRGYKYVWSNLLLKTLLISYSVLVLSIGIFQSLQIYYLSKDLHLNTFTIGLILSLGNIGMIFSAFLSKFISNKLGDLVTIALSLFCYFLGFILYFLAKDTTYLLIFFGQTLISFALPLYNVCVLSIRQTIIPNELLGRTTSIWRLAGRGLIPLGSLLAAFLSLYVNVEYLMLIAGLISLISVFIIVTKKRLLKMVR